MDRVLVFVDWENIHYTLERIYRVSVIPQKCLECIVIRAKEYGRPHVDVYYSDHLRGSELGRAIRACGAYAQPIFSAREEKNLADTYIATEAIRQYIHQKPAAVIIVSGDNGYTPVLRAIKDEGGEAVIFSFKEALADILQNSIVGGDPVILDELILPHSTPLGASQERLVDFKEKSAATKQQQNKPRIGPFSPATGQPGRPPAAPRPKQIQPKPVNSSYSAISGSEMQVVLKLLEALCGKFGDQIYACDDLPEACASRSEEWTPILDVVHDAIAKGQLSVVSPAGNGAEDYYVPNWEHPAVRQMLLALVVFIGKLRYMSADDPAGVPRELLFDQICGDERERGLYYSPDKRLLQDLSEGAKTIGAIRAGTTKDSVYLVQDHPLTRSSIPLKIQFKDLPKNLQANLRALEKDVLAISPDGKARISAVRQKFGKRANSIIEIGVALGLIDANGRAHDNSTVITLKRVADAAKVH